MKYISETDIINLDMKWPELIKSIEEAISCIRANDFSQPIKPYLRYGNHNNRIIAMPAYVGGEIQSAGIKWIASFPENLKNGLRRAHSVTVLNDPDNGVPVAIMNTPLLSIYRTVAVSGTMMKQINFMHLKNDITALIMGLGPIGEHHYLYLKATYGDKIKNILIYDISKEKVDQFIRKYAHDDRLVGCSNWQEAYEKSDLVITCTVASEPFIHVPPKKGSLHLNVSLRDYHEDLRLHFDQIIVDDWEEVCREGTYIERLHISRNLQSHDVLRLTDLGIPQHSSPILPDQTIIFCPMGMAIFDVAVAHYFLERSVVENVGVLLPQ